MARNSRQQLEIEYRRMLIKDTWIKLGVFGVTQQQIADQVTEDFDIAIDQPTVSRDLKVIKYRMQKQGADELRAEFFAGYMRLITEAREGWRRSLEDAVTETTEIIEVAGAETQNERVKASTRRTGQSGNPSFLDQEQKYFAAMRKMFGVDAPDRQENINIDLNNLSDEQLQRIANGEHPATVLADTSAS